MRSFHKGTEGEGVMVFGEDGGANFRYRAALPPDADGEFVNSRRQFSWLVMLSAIAVATDEGPQWLTAMTVIKLSAFCLAVVAFLHA